MIAAIPVDAAPFFTSTLGIVIIAVLACAIGFTLGAMGLGRKK